MNRNLPRLVIAALRGGCGKTTITLGLIAAWRRRGLRLVPFKKGPDYIDAGWLAQAAARSCFNLDPYLMGREGVLCSFQERTVSTASDSLDGAVIEGNRGLFDGLDEQGTYSTAELAKMLDAPVVLIVDCTKVTRTLAALVAGCRDFDPDMAMKAVILNQVATARQEALVRGAIENATGIPVVGAVPRLNRHELPERHLGLVPHQEHPTAARALNHLAGLAEAHLDLDRLWDIASRAETMDVPACPPVEPNIRADARLRIGVIRDSVFQFYYPENLETLERLGAELVIFSSLGTEGLPEVDALYLGGGFPETHAEVLAGNELLRTDIARAAEAGLPIYAECGGLMYLGRNLVIQDRYFPMAGVFPVDFTLEKRPQGHGYTTLRVKAANPYYPEGETLVGHEFHYSRPLAYRDEDLNFIFDVERGTGFDGQRDGLLRHRAVGLYTHAHALGNTRWAESLVSLAAEYRRERRQGGRDS